MSARDCTSQDGSNVSKALLLSNAALEPRVEHVVVPLLSILMHSLQLASFESERHTSTMPANRTAVGSANAPESSTTTGDEGGEGVDDAPHTLGPGTDPSTPKRRAKKKKVEAQQEHAAASEEGLQEDGKVLVELT